VEPETLPIQVPVEALSVLMSVTKDDDATSLPVAGEYPFVDKIVVEVVDDLDWFVVDDEIASANASLNLLFRSSLSSGPNYSMSLTAIFVGLYSRRSGISGYLSNLQNGEWH
ncbi:hypothetical protein Tco_0295536, partial [Tanacetum coccineum]